MNIRKLALSAAVSGLALSVASVSYAAEDGDRGHVNRPGPEVEAPEVGDPAEISFDDFAGGSFASKPIVDLDQVITQIDRGLQESANGGMITFSFLKMDHLTGLYNNPNYGFTAGNGVGPLNDGQRAAARDAIAYWDDLIAPRFVEKNGVGADIRFANSADPAQAYAYYPNDANGWKFRSDVFIADPELNWTNNWVNFNGYGLTAVVHEIGHSQGLSHPGAYNFTPGVPLTYANNAEYAQDSEQYSIMSYWAPSSTQAILIDYSYFLFGNAQTPMVHDILTIQSKYGADTTTRTGDTVYGFNSTAGRDVFDFALNPWPNFAIYDAGGNDTIDASGFTESVFLNLEPGKFSSAAQTAPSVAEINANRAALTVLTNGVQTFGPIGSTAGTQAFYQSNAEFYIRAYFGVSGIFANAHDNLAIAYGTVIENAIGGTKRDLLLGNDAANVLKGNGGDDVLDGLAGPDTYYGGAGNDTFVVSTLDVGDAIADFVSSEDTVDLTAFGGLSFIGGAAFSGVAGELSYDGASLSADLDGDGAADWSMSVGAGLTAANLAL